MGKVLITRSKLDGLATTIAAKSGATLPLTIAQMDAAVEGIETGGNDFVVTLSYNDQTEMWEPDCTINELQTAYAGGKNIAFVGEGAEATGWFYDDDYSFVYSIYTSGGNNAVIKEYWFTAQGISHTDDYQLVFPNFESPSRTYTPTTQQQTETITYDSSQGYNGIQQVNVTVNAMPTGTAGTPTATKGTVSNHAVSVTPSVTNTTGYITGGTKTGTAVSVSATELVSGTLSITSSGTKDVTNYASASVAAGGATASATKGTVSNHSVTVTPSVTRTAGYVTAGSSNGTAVTVSASELVSGTYTVDSSGTKNVTNYASASVAAGSATASATKGSVSNHSVSVTPSVTRTAGWVSAGTSSGTAVTVSASELVSGSETKTENGTYDVTNLASLIVDVNGGSSSYTRTVVVPQQTFTPTADQNNAYQAALTSTSGLVSGEPYIITYDGEEYVCDCSDPLWGSDRMMGTIAAMWGDRGDGVFPFAVDYTGGTMYVAAFDLNQHTIKVEHLEFVDGPLNLITKSITANGTYTASSDNADGYSSVTVNVSSGGGTYQAKTNISPTTSSQTVRPDSGYDALSSVQINAMPTGTAGTPSATKGTVSNHSVSVTPSVTNTTGYITGGTKTGTAVTVSASELVSGSQTITDNGTVNVTNLASVTVAIPIVTYHTSSSAPTSSQGSDGDLWLVTS